MGFWDILGPDKGRQTEIVPISPKIQNITANMFFLFVGMSASYHRNMNTWLSLQYSWCLSHIFTDRVWRYGEWGIWGHRPSWWGWLWGFGYRRAVWDSLFDIDDIATAFWSDNDIRNKKLERDMADQETVQERALIFWSLSLHGCYEAWLWSNSGTVAQWQRPPCLALRQSLIPCWNKHLGSHLSLKSAASFAAALAEGCGNWWMFNPILETVPIATSYFPKSWWLLKSGKRTLLVKMVKVLKLFMVWGNRLLLPS